MIKRPGWLFSKTRIFHMTAINNLPSIFQNGGLRAKNYLSSQGVAYTNVAYESIQDQRSRITLPDDSNLHDYVPFHFAPRSPMLFAIAQGEISGCSTSQDEMVYLVTNAEKFVERKFVFCDHHPIMKPVEWYNDLADLSSIDWDIFFEEPLVGGYAKFWQDRLDNPRWANRKSIRQAEFLVHQTVLIDDLIGFAVMNEKTKNRLSVICGQYNIKQQIIIKRDWYK